MPDTPIGTTPPSPDLEFRVTRLEHDMGDVKSILGQMLPMLVRIDATLPHFATKAEVLGEVSSLRNEMHAEFAKVRAELAEKPSKTYLWAVLGVLIAAYAAGLAALAVLK